MKINELKVGGTYLLHSETYGKQFVEIAEIQELDEERTRVYFEKEITVDFGYTSIHTGKRFCTSWALLNSSDRFTPISKEKFDSIFNSFGKLSKTLDKLTETTDSPKIF